MKKIVIGIVLAAGLMWTGVASAFSEGQETRVAGNNVKVWAERASYDSVNCVIARNTKVKVLRSVPGMGGQVWIMVLDEPHKDCEGYVNSIDLESGERGFINIPGRYTPGMNYWP